ncbi:hypothetical protein PLICRDRAFT_127339, partial [Plicaturopsis crispa FD-325 SS-3]
MAHYPNASKRLPWVDLPLPVSKLPSSKLYPPESSCFYTDADDDYRWPPPNYPYRLDTVNHRRVIFYKMRGHGHPPADVGYPGDIYVDTQEPLRLYHRHSSNWVEAPAQAIASGRIMHPYAPAFLFGGQSAMTVTWMSPQSIRLTRESAAEMR